MQTGMNRGTWNLDCPVLFLERIAVADEYFL